MVKITKEAALLYHSQGKPGKIDRLDTTHNDTGGRTGTGRTLRELHTGNLTIE